jgi:hypothetical protein
VKQGSRSRSLPVTVSRAYRVDRLWPSFWQNIAGSGRRRETAIRPPGNARRRRSKGPRSQVRAGDSTTSPRGGFRRVTRRGRAPRSSRFDQPSSLAAGRSPSTPRGTITPPATCRTGDLPSPRVGGRRSRGFGRRVFRCSRVVLAKRAYHPQCGALRRRLSCREGARST